MKTDDREVSVPVNITVQVSMRRVYDLVVTGIESGGYGSFEFAIDSGRWDKDGWELAEAGETEAFCRIRLQDKYAAEKTVYSKLYDGYLKTGLRLMAEEHPQHFNNFMEENDDAITGDVFLQCVVFGEVIYG